MTAVCTRLVFAVAGLAAASACTAGALVVGHDTPATPGEQDAMPLPDAPAGPCAEPGGTCLPSGAACSRPDTNGLVCPSAGDFCCAVRCPELIPPAPGFCDGGPYASLYDSHRCVVGFDCAPVACAAAGGQCVAVAPGACPSGSVGDANKYSCGGGIGVMCCLP